MNNIEEFCLVKLLAHKQSPTEWNWFAVCKISAIVRLSVPLFVCNVHIERESEKTKCSTNGNKWLWCEIAFQLRPCVFKERKFKNLFKTIVHCSSGNIWFCEWVLLQFAESKRKTICVCDCWIETINWIWGLFSPSTVYHTMTQPVDMPIPKHTQTNSPFVYLVWFNLRAFDIFAYRYLDWFLPILITFSRRFNVNT